MAGIELKSPAFDDHAPLPRTYARDGDNVSPPLTWSGVPDGTAELVLLCEDPDAPGGTFLHWLVTGIDPASRGVEAGRTPPGGTAHVNDFGNRGWDGSQPPPGDRPHRYFFRLYALPEKVLLPQKATASDVHAELDGRQLADGTIVATYQR